MAETNGEIFRRALDLLNERGELDPSLYSEDVVWQTRSDGPGSSTFQGLDGLRRGMQSFGEIWAELHGELTELTEQGDAVIGVIRWSLRGHSGVELEVVEAWVNWFDKNGKVVRIEQHGTEEEALAAAADRASGAPREGD